MKIFASVSVTSRACVAFFEVYFGVFSAIKRNFVSFTQ